MSEEIKHDKCARCKTWRLPSSFLNDSGRKLKTCKKCREKEKEKREKNKCEHNREKSKCKVCNPVGHIKAVMYHLVRKKIGTYYDPTIPKEKYLGIDGNGFLKYINSKMKEGMNWNNHAEHWSIGYDVTPETYKITDDMTQEEILSITNYRNIDVWFGVHPLSPHYKPNIDPNTGKQKV